MRDIIVEDIPEEHYQMLCKEGAKLGISADDYLTLLVKDYINKRRVKMQAEADGAG